jgi:hypothetical protein
MENKLYSFFFRVFADTDNDILERILRIFVDLMMEADELVSIVC